MRAVPSTLRFSHDDSLMLGFLTSVREWSVAFFEFATPYAEDLACSQRRTSLDKPWAEKGKQTSFTFKLVSDLLDRGHGTLAGKMLRKAFLLAEDILTLEGPVLIWNLLEIMYHMVKLRHEQLFQILLAHLSALVNGRMSKAHPLSAMLHKLRGLVENLTRKALTFDNFSPTPPSSSSSSPSTSGNGTTTSSLPSIFSHIISPLLEEAWTLNAQTVLGNFDPQFFPLYLQLHWESCSIGLPPAIIGTTTQWLSYIETQQMNSAITDAHRSPNNVPNTAVEEDRMVQSLLAPRIDASPPQDYEMLRASSAAALSEYGYAFLSRGLIPNTDAATMRQILPALIKARMLQEPAPVVERSCTASNDTTGMSRSQAGNMACVVRALMELNSQHRSDGIRAPLGDVERIRSTVALRQYAHGEVDPQVMREMWLLEDAFAAAGRYGEAQKVGRSVICRLEKYTQDVPLDSV